MWVVISACKVRGRLLEPGEPLPDVSDEGLERLRQARCIEWVEPDRESVQEAATEPPSGAEPPPPPKAPKKTRKKRR